MKLPTTVIFNVDERRVTDLYYGEEHYKVRGRCNQCGKCCRISPPVSFKKKSGVCEHLDNKNKCAIHDTKPWFCTLWPYDLEAFESQPEECTIKLERVT